jgi:2-polyprenyl-3-methyl-5-hydroxy-6-metoxy-1,4-benzoquinol methylase
MPKAAQFLPEAKSLKDDKGVDLEVCQCSGCGLVQLSSKPVPYYKESIRAAGFSDEMKDFRKKQFKEFVQRYSLFGKKIIEVGCGLGEYLLLMQESKVKAHGLEYSEKSAEICVKNGLKVSRGFIDNSNYKIDNAPFDGFFMLNFLEHLPDPNSTLRGIYNNLTDDAVGLVEVPNFDMLLRNKLFSEFMSDHLFYFTADTLSTALKINGFEIIECNQVWRNYIISAVVKKRKRQDISHFSEQQKKIKKQIEEYISRFGDKKVAIWSAGHQALAVISLMNLGDKIKYIVDSATFKQNKFTPVSHIPIVSLATLESDPVDAIIVMAASYSDEVTRIIQKKINKNINIAILRNHGLEII